MWHVIKDSPTGGKEEERACKSLETWHITENSLTEGKKEKSVDE
jgi:hypothetical protein